MNSKTGETQWEHPLEQYYRGLIYMKKGCQEKVDRAKMTNPPTETEVREMGEYFNVGKDATSQREFLSASVLSFLVPSC